ncbi:MaoC family dehydratase [Pseudoduganella sp. UC29_106]|uniref:MaoC family dehydratase n=1 Tax=Pseudoduganella sp. UC29_106 TaxID=3374553 RepID=UPI0037579447
MVKRYLEDLEVGERWTSAPIAITQEDIINFGLSFDPQPFHTDPEAAAAGPFGGLVASGWHLASMAMRVSVEARIFGDLPVVGVGVDELRWLQPVRVDDVLTVERELVEIITLPDKPKRGIAKARLELKNQRGEVVMRMYGLSSVPKRPAA